jgi:hypothetical protein
MVDKMCNIFCLKHGRFAGTQCLGELYRMTNTFCLYLTINTWRSPTVLHQKIVFKKLKCIFECIFGDIHLSWKALYIYIYIWYLWVVRVFNIMCTWIFLELFITKLFLSVNNVIEFFFLIWHSWMIINLLNLVATRWRSLHPQSCMKF